MRSCSVTDEQIFSVPLPGPLRTKDAMFTSAAFGRSALASASAYVHIGREKEVEMLLVLHEEEYRSDGEDVGLVDVAKERMG